MISIEQTAAVARLVIDRPARRNAIDGPTARQLGDALSNAFDDESVRVVVLTGAGDTFCTGHDLKAAAEGAGEDGRERDPWTQQDDWVRIFHLLHRAPKPSVAVVRGHAVAGGFTLAMGCDFVLAERSAVFGAFEMRHGFPAAVCTPILARLIGARLGLEFALFGEEIGAERLFACGLVNRLADDAAALAKVEAQFVGRLAALEPRAVKLTRDLFRASETMPLDQALAAGAQVNQLIAATGGFARAGRRLGKK